jgi:hypothetical protein
MIETLFVNASGESAFLAGKEDGFPEAVVAACPEKPEAPRPDDCG